MSLSELEWDGLLFRAMTRLELNSQRAWGLIQLLRCSPRQTLLSELISCPISKRGSHPRTEQWAGSRKHAKVLMFHVRQALAEVGLRDAISAVTRPGRAGWPDERGAFFISEASAARVIGFLLTGDFEDEKAA